MRQAKLRISPYFVKGQEMAGRCCVFVDGENLRHSIVKLFEGTFDRRDYLPKKADWAGFFDWLVNKASSDCQRLRTYWYCIEHLDFHPYLPLPTNPVDLRKLLSKDKKLRNELNALTEPALSTRMADIAADLKEGAAKMRSRFQGWRDVQDGIAKRHNAVEFRRAGAITYNLFTGDLGQEKAVDVKLAIDMNELRKIYDVAIIVSGDQDYVPAVQAVKDRGKTVINVAFEGRNGKLLPGGARRLNNITDSALIAKYDDLKALLHV